MNLAALLAAAEKLPDGFRLEIPQEWHQGRTAYGGLSAALAHVAALRLGEELPALRSAQFGMMAPLYGEIELCARLLRRGKNAAWVAVDVARAGTVGFSASFVFMAPVASALTVNDRSPPAGLIAPEEAQPLAFRDQSPAFLRSQFEVRFALPRDPAKRAEVCWWVRLREWDGIDPVTGLLLVADALPPGVMPLLPPGVPVSSMHWQVNVLGAAQATHGGWYLLRSSGDYAEHGCSSQRMDVWNADGAPVMAGMQSVAVFG